jgi:hypothetical protein
MNLKEIKCENVYWIHLAQDGVQQWKFVNSIMHLLIPLKEEGCLDHLSDHQFLKGYPAQWS